MATMKLSLFAFAFLFLALHVKASYLPETPPPKGYHYNREQTFTVIPHYFQAEFDRLNAESEARFLASQMEKEQEKERPKRRNLLVGRYGFRIGKRGILNQDYKEEAELTPLLSRPLKRDVDEYDR